MNGLRIIDKPMQNIVLDMNSLIIAVSSRSLYHKVWQSFLNGHYTLCVSNDIVEEYYEVIARNINPRVAEAIVYTILSRENVKRLDPHYRFHLICSDEDDNKFVDCAIAANARYIVTEDRHFDVLKQVKFPVVDVIGIEDFARQLEVLER